MTEPTTARQPGPTSVLVEGRNAFHLSAPLSLIQEDREVAWEGAKDLIDLRFDRGFSLARFVSADPAGNTNGHIFGLDDLRASHQSVVNTPLNMGHAQRWVVGTNIATELLYPTTVSGEGGGPVAAASVEDHPYTELLSVIWKGVFPDEYEALRRTQAEGRAFVSMETIPESLTCMDEGCDGQTYPYRGIQSDTYCEALNRPRSKKMVNKPTFVGAGLILPPMRPGWRGADVTEVAGLIEAHLTEAEALYEAVKVQAPHLSPKDWDLIMAAHLMEAFTPRAHHQRTSPKDIAHWAAEEALGDRRVSAEERRALARKNQALPDGTYPIATVSDLRNAIRLARAGHGNVAAAKRLIVRMAEKFNRTDLIPDDWKARVSDAVMKKRPAAKPADRKPPPKAAEKTYASVEAGVLASLARETAANSGVIVCLVPPLEIREALAALGTEPVEQIHVTVVFLGNDAEGTGTLPPAPGSAAGQTVSQELVAGVVAGFAAGAKPLRAKISGLGRFALEDGSEVTYASVDAPGLPELYSRLVAALEGAGIPVSHLHGLSPHISIAYAAAGKGPTALPEGLEWDVEELSLWWGQAWSFPLGAGVVSVT